jgi:hypothetical protein
VARHAVALVVVCGLFGISVGGCDDDGDSPQGHAWCDRADRGCVGITEDDLGADWPFSLPAGALSCKRGGAITLAVRSERLNLNATGDGAYGLNPAAHDRGYAPPYAIWQWDDESHALDLRKSLKPVIDRGRELCG